MRKMSRVEGKSGMKQSRRPADEPAHPLPVPMLPRAGLQQRSHKPNRVAEN